MPVTIASPAAIEESTYVIDVSFFDEAGAPATPNTDLAWSLMDADGNIINSREAVAIAPAPTITIVLHGADLAVGEPAEESDYGYRYLLLTGTYDSSLGANLELREQVQFSIGNLVGTP